MFEVVSYADFLKKRMQFLSLLKSVLSLGIQ